MAGNYHRWSKSELREIARRYTRWADLDREHNLAAQAIRRHGWYDELCGHMEKRVQRLSEQEVRAKARLCATRVEFERKYPGEYGRALKLGVMDDLGLPLQKRRHTKASLKKIAARYQSLKEFYRGDNSAYQTAVNRGILYEICSHMEQGTTRGYQLYLYEFPDGAQYVGITKRRERHSQGHSLSGPVFCYARDFFGGETPEPKILEEGMNKLEAAFRERVEIKRRRKKGLYLLNKADGGQTGGSPYAHSEKSVRELASQYESGVRFRKAQPAAANWARRHGIELVFPNDTESRTKWTDENIWQAVARCETYSDFISQYASAWAAAKRKRMLPQIWEKLPPGRIVGEDQREKLKRAAIEVGAEHESLKDFRENEPRLYSIASREGVLDEIVANGTARIRHKAFTKSELSEIAHKYKTRADFQRAHPSAYKSARTKGLLNEICGHMVPQKRRWNRNTILAAAREWRGETISDFIRATGGLYNKAKQIGIWDEVKTIILDSGAGDAA